MKLKTSHTYVQKKRKLRLVSFLAFLVENIVDFVELLT